MILAVITHTKHIWSNDQYYGYAPYVREMNIWFNYVNKVIVVAPLMIESHGPINLPYDKNDIDFRKIPSVSNNSLMSAIRTLVLAPLICVSVYRAMKKADHIHLRCPGNIGLLGCIVQIFFPKKAKTAKYAGNWDPKSSQPWSYRLQKWILSNSFITRNMQVLVYGKWPEQSKNIKPFFTATYNRDKISGLLKKNFQEPYKFMFVGSLVPGKRPLYAIQLIESLQARGIDCHLQIYGEGSELNKLQAYVDESGLYDNITFFGNKEAETIEMAYKENQFLVLPSKSEGWPKVVAEAMFWGMIPLVTKISCVPWMLDNGSRGVLLNCNLQFDTKQFLELLEDERQLNNLSLAAQEWSHNFTLNDFSEQVKKLIHGRTTTN